ncbi:hypothetical protein [Mucisphaera sp.]|uniref:hypothetical protein n=1 Tax=Mucisphaera sp. TaxID=2913024 RepID=UPI003D0F5CD4
MLRVALCIFVLLVNAANAYQPSSLVFGLDDNPSNPRSSAFGILPGGSADSPYYTPSFATGSPTLAAFTPDGDAWGFRTDSERRVGVVFQAFTNTLTDDSRSFSYIDSLSKNLADHGPSGGALNLAFSVNRYQGQEYFRSSESSATGDVHERGYTRPWSSVSTDVFRTTSTYTDPFTLRGTLPPDQGYIASVVGHKDTFTGNRLLVDGYEKLGLRKAGDHKDTSPSLDATGDNIDSMILRGLATNEGELVEDIYFTISPDEAVRQNTATQRDLLHSMDIYLRDAAGQISVFASAESITSSLPIRPIEPIDNFLVQVLKNYPSIDALTIWDNGTRGVMEPGIDFALFSLSPNGFYGTNDKDLIDPRKADIFFTDFNGSFAIYATAESLGVAVNSGSGPPVRIADDNIDALDIILSGDFNHDDRVDLRDLSVLASSFGDSATWSEGDADGSGAVDLTDLSLLASNFSAGSPKVPEPASTLPLLGLLLTHVRTSRTVR